MKNFSLVYAVCLAALSGDRTHGAASVENLQRVLAADGDADDAQFLARLIKAARGAGKTPVAHFVQSDVSQTSAMPPSD